jgi:hypothetical protein
MRTSFKARLGALAARGLLLREQVSSAAYAAEFSTIYLKPFHVVGARERGAAEPGGPGERGAAEPGARPGAAPDGLRRAGCCVEIYGYAA